MSVRPAWMNDVPVAVLLLVGFFTVPVGTVGHVVAGSAFAAIVIVHLVTRRNLAARLWRGVRRSRALVRQRWTSWAAIASAIVLTVSGFVQWAGVAGAIPVHSSFTYVLFLVAGVHVWQHRRTLLGRLRRPEPLHDRGGDHGGQQRHQHQDREQRGAQHS